MSTFYLDPNLAVTKRLLRWLSNAAGCFVDRLRPQRPAVLSGFTKVGNGNRWDVLSSVMREIYLVPIIHGCEICSNPADWQIDHAVNVSAGAHPHIWLQGPHARTAVRKLS